MVKKKRKSRKEVNKEWKLITGFITRLANYLRV